MQAADLRNRNNSSVSRRPDRWRSPCRSFLSEAEVRSVVMVVADVFIHQPPQVSLTQNDHMIEQVSAATADELFECLVEEEHEVLRKAELSIEADSENYLGGSSETICTTSDLTFTRKRSATA
jgi:hypothetical protein